VPAESAPDRHGYYELALANGGQYPPFVDSKNIPWWASVHDKLATTSIDRDPATNGLQLPERLPSSFGIFHCRAAPPIDDSGATDAIRQGNIFATLSYGLNFDVKRADGTVYECVPNSDPAYPALKGPSLTAADKDPDVINTSLSPPGGFHIDGRIQRGRYVVFGDTPQSGIGRGGALPCGRRKRCRPTTCTRPPCRPVTTVAPMSFSPTCMFRRWPRHSKCSIMATSPPQRQDFDGRSKSWKPTLPFTSTDFTGNTLLVTSGLCQGMRRLITSNNSNTLFFKPESSLRPGDRRYLQGHAAVPWGEDVNANTPLWTLPDD